MAWTSNKPEKIVIHCAATPDRHQFTIKDIDKWHKKRGWKSKSGIHCGYHWYIDFNGLIEQGRPETETGAHVRGQNKNSIGICLEGTWCFSQFQVESLIHLLKEIKSRSKITANDIHCHYEFTDQKTCPNISVHIIRKLFELSLK